MGAYSYWNRETGELRQDVDYYTAMGKTRGPEDTYERTNTPLTELGFMKMDSVGAWSQYYTQLYASEAAAQRMLELRQREELRAQRLAPRDILAPETGLQTAQAMGSGPGRIQTLGG